MARFVVIIHAPALNVYAISVTSEPIIGLRTLQAFCPFEVTLIHSIESASRTDDLEKTLHIKYASQHSAWGDFWFHLSQSDIDFLSSINSSNLTRLSGLIKRELVKPVIAESELPDFIQQQLDLCQGLLNNKPN